MSFVRVDTTPAMAQHSLHREQGGMLRCSTRSSAHDAGRCRSQPRGPAPAALCTHMYTHITPHTHTCIYIHIHQPRGQAAAAAGASCGPSSLPEAQTHIHTDRVREMHGAHDLQGGTCCSSSSCRSHLLLISPCTLALPPACPLSTDPASVPSEMPACTGVAPPSCDASG